MLSVKVLAAWVPAESVTVTVMFTGPAVVGVPPRTLPEKVSPAPPPDHVRGGTPPVALKGCENGTPTAAFPKELVVITRGGAVTLMMNPLDAEVAVESVTVTVKAKVPTAFAVPVSEPSLVNLPGKEPVALNEYG